jgi:sterol desaturase/sphingolipid hydroxylase (fatty acid hydroxylase superfamily)
MPPKSAVTETTTATAPVAATTKTASKQHDVKTSSTSAAVPTAVSDVETTSSLEKAGVAFAAIVVGAAHLSSVNVPEQYSAGVDVAQVCLGLYALRVASSWLGSLMPSATGGHTASFRELVCFALSFCCVSFTIFTVVTRTVEFMRQGMPWPNAVGLMTGITSVAIGQVLIILYHYVRSEILFKNEKAIETSGKDNTIQIKPILYHPLGFFYEVKGHLARPEAFAMLVTYLSVTWMFNLMPESYYDWDGKVDWKLVLVKLLFVDVLTYSNHLTEHRVPAIYKHGHKPHHRFKNPQIFDAFNGSNLDTLVLIVFPLYTGAQLFHLNNWSYVAFGTVYASYLMMIHSEFPHGYDEFLRSLGVYVAEDHHVHHAQFNYNYSHFFTYMDRLLGTYKRGETIKTFRSFQKRHGRGVHSKQQ